MSTNDVIRFRIRAAVSHQITGAFLGAGVGECSSNEEKYCWRNAVCQEEYNDTPEDRRRIKYKKNYGKVEKVQQVRTNPSDLANTILKMAKKRALVDGILTVTSASDCFTQDLEDLPEELLDKKHDNRPKPSPDLGPTSQPEDEYPEPIMPEVDREAFEQAEQSSYHAPDKCGKCGAELVYHEEGKWGPWWSCSKWREANCDFKVSKKKWDKETNQ